MLKTRVIPVLLSANGFCVKPKRFEPPGRNVGPMSQYIKTMDSRNVDELIIIDTLASKTTFEPNYERIKSWAADLFCPLTVGGGIYELAHIENLLKSGADKVCLGSVANNLDFVKQAAEKFGSQCITVSVDVKKHTKQYAKAWHEDVTYFPYIKSGTQPIDLSLTEYVRALEESGAGELLLTSIDKDGTRSGYDLKLNRLVTHTVNIPVIANGGCAGFDDMKSALECGVHAVAAGSMFLFTALTPHNCSMYLANKGFNVRTDAR